MKKIVPQFSLLEVLHSMLRCGAVVQPAGMVTVLHLIAFSDSGQCKTHNPDWKQVI